MEITLPWWMMPFILLGISYLIAAVRADIEQDRRNRRK